LLGLEESVDFLGTRDEIEHVYRSARVFVLTSRDEGLSVAMTEAMASGLPAVVSDVGDLGDLVRDGRNGHLVPVGAIDNFVDKIGRLLDNKRYYTSLSRAAREDTSAHAGVEAVSDLYRELLLGESARRNGRP